MNREDKNISNAAGDRRTYLSPRTEIIKIGTINFLAESESLAIPRTDENTDEAYGKRWQGDLDSWDEDNTWDDTETYGTYRR